MGISLEERRFSKAHLQVTKSHEDNPSIPLSHIFLEFILLGGKFFVDIGFSWFDM
jgi:hypothetical protein